MFEQWFEDAVECYKGGGWNGTRVIPRKIGCASKKQEISRMINDWEGDPMTLSPPRWNVNSVSTPLSTLVFPSIYFSYYKFISPNEIRIPKTK
jgi:hypothetical protein